MYVSNWKVAHLRIPRLSQMITNLSHWNDRVDKISIDFKKTEKRLAMNIMYNMFKKYKELKLVIETKVNYLYDLEELNTTIQDHWESYYCDKETDNDSDYLKSEDEKNKDHTFNLTDEKKRRWKGRNDNVVYYHCGKPGHTKEKCFKLIG